MNVNLGSVKKKVFVSGCYDLLHSGHVAFFKEASTYGDLYVGIGSDLTIRELKGCNTVNSELERLYMVKSIRYVKDAWINQSSGIMDFEADVKSFKPGVFIVNEDGNSPAKASFCKELGIDYVILKRIPEPGLNARSTTAIRTSDTCLLPYRLDLAGTWIDQPYVNKYGPGWAITLSLEPIVEYNERSGMSTSTRNAARMLWPFQLPPDHPEKLAKLLFHFENEPGRVEVSGAQDSIGICLPGLNRHFYENGYWPTKIETIEEEETLIWLEDHLFLVTLWPREPGLNLLDQTHIDGQNVAQLTSAADLCWQAIQNKDLMAFAQSYLDSFEAQVRMFPKMLNPKVQAVIDEYKNQALAWKLAGAGAGGYLALVSDKPIEGAMKLKIRRKGTL
jgi:cytidyltransferase-like protein